MSPAECPISLTRDCQDRALLGMGLLHAAYNGSPQHRREIKKEPCMQADYLTVPLSSRRAAGVLGHDYKRMGLRSEQVDHETYADCAVPPPCSASTWCAPPYLGMLLYRHGKFHLTMHVVAGKSALQTMPVC